MFIKELSFPHMAPTDDTFFNRNWAGACGGRWAGPGLLAGWAVGCWTVWAVIGSLQRWFATGFEGVSPLQETRKKGGRRGLRPWPLRCLSQFLSERKERLLRGQMCRV